MRFGAYCMKAESRLFISDESIVFGKRKVCRNDEVPSFYIRGEIILSLSILELFFLWRRDK